MQEWVKQIKRALDNYTEASNPTKDAVFAHLLKVVEDSKNNVEVVRCRDCAVPHNKWTGCPRLNGIVTPPDFYCSCGEKKK